MFNVSSNFVKKLTNVKSNNQREDSTGYFSDEILNDLIPDSDLFNEECYIQKPLLEHKQNDSMKIGFLELNQFVNRQQIWLLENKPIYFKLKGKLSENMKKYSIKLRIWLRTIEIFIET